MLTIIGTLAALPLIAGILAVYFREQANRRAARARRYASESK